METIRSQERDGTARDAGALRCPECGATNRAGAEWCGQCFARFDQPQAPSTSDPAPDGSTEADDVDDDLVARLREARATLSELGGDRPVRKAPPPPPPGASSGRKRGVTPAPSAAARAGGSRAPIDGGAFNVDGAEITWTCSRCDSVNDFESNICSVCGTTFAEAIKPPEEPKPARDANMAALISLFLPGAGHAYLGMWGQGVARAVISLWVVTVAIFSAAQAAPQAKVMAGLFGLVATALWVVAAHDAYREASAASKLVILKQKMFLYLVLSLLLLSVIMIFSTALGARGA